MSVAVFTPLDRKSFSYSIWTVGYPSLPIKVDVIIYMYVYICMYFIFIFLVVNLSLDGEDSLDLSSFSWFSFFVVN